MIYESQYHGYFQEKKFHEIILFMEFGIKWAYEAASDWSVKIILYAVL